MKKSHLLGVVCACITLLGIPSANASIVINFFESGGNVEASYSGFLNLSATQGYQGDSIGGDGIWSLYGAAQFTSGNSNYYGVDASWTPFGTDHTGTYFDTSSGDALHLFSGSFIGVPIGYISGTNISGSATVFAASFASLGLTPGSYVSTLTNGLNTDTVTVSVGAVPIPAAVWLFCSGLLGLVGLARRKKA